MRTDRARVYSEVTRRLGLVPEVADSGIVSTDAGPETPRLVECRRGSVLIIDDDELVAGSLRRVLRAHDVTVTRSGRDALAQLAAGKTFDVVFCDLMMPEMTGMEFFSELSRTWPSLAPHVIFLTGGAFTSEAHSFLETASNVRIDKPFSPDRVRAAVQQALS